MIPMLVRDQNGIQVARRDPHLGQPPLGLPRRKTAVHQDACATPFHQGRISPASAR
jgi:hypothetical protein